MQLICGGLWGRLPTPSLLHNIHPLTTVAQKWLFLFLKKPNQVRVSCFWFYWFLRFFGFFGKG